MEAEGLPGKPTPVGRRQGCAMTAQEPRLARVARMEARHGWRVCRPARAMLVGQRGSQRAQTRAGRSEQGAGRAYGGGTGRDGIAAGVARALSRCPRRAGMAWLLLLRDVQRVDKPCKQASPQTLDKVVHDISSCRRQGKLYDHRVCPYNHGRACGTWVSRSRRPATALTAGRPPSDGQLGEAGPERARDTHMGVCRIVTGRGRRRPCQARRGGISLYVVIYAAYSRP
jgi:hypothetical protein